MKTTSTPKRQANLFITNLLITGCPSFSDVRLARGVGRCPRTELGPDRSAVGEGLPAPTRESLEGRQQPSSVCPWLRRPLCSLSTWSALAVLERPPDRARASSPR